MTDHTDHTGGWIQTFTGRQFWPLDPRASNINIRDIAHALSNQCRYSGHAHWFYSVAEHSVRVSRDCAPQDALWGLLHDASEAYLVDLARPLKHSAAGFGDVYRECETALMLAVCERFNMALEEPESVKLSDKNLLVTEQRDLMGPVPAGWWTGGGNPLPETIKPLAPEDAEFAFLCRYDELTGTNTAARDLRERLGSKPFNLAERIAGGD